MGKRKKPDWEPVLEMDMDDGTHTCYAKERRDGTLIFLTQMHDDTWDVELGEKGSTYIDTLKNFKTLAGAKKFADKLDLD